MLTQNTLTLLKSLIPLNNSMVISPKMTGADEFKNVTYLANLDLLEENIPVFGIFAMDQFTQAMELLDEPNITYNPKTKRIKAQDNNTDIEYITSDPASLDYAQVDPDVINSTLKADSVLTTEVTKDILQKIKKAYSVFKNFDTLNIIADDDGAKISISNLNTFSKNNNAWSMKIDGEKTGKFNVALPLESIMKIPQADYTLIVKYNSAKDVYRVVLTNDLITFVMSLKQ